MSARQPEKHSQWNPLGYWHRLSLRWKMTLVGTAMGAFASSLWTAPAAYLALSNGYIGHGIGYVIVTVLGIAGMAGHHALLWNQAGEGSHWNRMKGGPRPKDTGTTSP